MSRFENISKLIGHDQSVPEKLLSKDEEYLVGLFRLILAHGCQRVKYSGLHCSSIFGYDRKDLCIVCSLNAVAEEQRNHVAQI